MKQTIKSFVFECDYDKCDRWKRVVVGDPIPEEGGRVSIARGRRVKNSRDADLAMRRRHGWSIGNAHFCDKHKVDL